MSHEAVDQMVKKYKNYRSKWKDSEVCSTLERMLEGMLEKIKNRITIKNVVCLDSGTFYITENEERSYTRLAGLMTVINFLKKSYSIKYTVQALELTLPDTQFLGRFGFEIVNTPAAAISRVDNHTFLYAIQCFVLDWRSLFQRPQPAAIIADGLTRPNITERLSGYEQMDLPVYSDATKGEDDEPHDWVSLFVRN